MTFAPTERSHSVGYVAASSKACLCGWSCISVEACSLASRLGVRFVQAFVTKNISLETNKRTNGFNISTVTPSRHSGKNQKKKNKVSEQSSEKSKTTGMHVNLFAKTHVTIARLRFQ